MNKVCACCKKVHAKVPDNARPDFQGEIMVAWVWECSCGSTLYFYKFEREILKSLILEGVI